MNNAINLLIKGGIVMIPLICCSLISLALTIERLLFWRWTKSTDIAQELLRKMGD